jgi:hypothetical protein
MKMPGGGQKRIVTMNNFQKDNPKEWGVWGGKQMSLDISFNKRKNFFTQWQSASFNGGVV